MADAAGGADGPPVPFNDEDSFKAWMAAGNKYSKKAVAIDDFAEPTEEELELMKAVKPLLSKRNQESVDDVTLSRFCRGYAMLHFAGAEDKVERTAIITNLALDWMREVDFENLPDKKLPKREEFAEIWPTCVSGLTDDKRPVWFATSLGDIKKFTPEEVGMFHAQDMATLHRVKREAATKAGRKYTGLHHLVILDAGWDDGPGLDRALLKYLKNSLIHKCGANTTQHFQPDALSKAFVVNASFFLRALFSFAKLFMEATTAAKYNLYGSDFMDALAEAGIPAESIPMYLGGVAPNPPGLRHKVKVDRGRKTTLTCVVGDWQPADVFLYRVEFPRGECDVSVMLDGVAVDVTGNSADIPLKPHNGHKIVIVFDNKGASSSVQVTLIATVDVTSA
eukprot:m.86730 g.86730  ORF g.86730 m.86730 type:complete len:394 (+) comp9675_c0_seq1:51-1232(+)